MKPLRGLCIGAGYFSQFHLDGWSRTPEVETVGLCDMDRDRAAQKAGKFGIARVFTDAVQALDELRPDFVDIITRADSHRQLVELAATRGVAILCQKPLAPDLATSRALVEIAQRANVPLMVHENFRFQPWHRELKRLLQSGTIGRCIHSLYFRSRPGDGWGEDAYLSRQPYFREMPRFLVYETGVHIIDTFRFLAGEIDESYALLRKLNDRIRGEDTGLLTFRFANGAVGVWDANRYNEGTAADPRLTFGELLIEGNDGSLRLHADGRITIQPLGQPEREHLYSWKQRGFAGDCVHAVQQHFVKSLREKTPFETSGSEYLRNLIVQEAVYRSAEQNRPVRISELQAETLPAQTGRRIVDLSLAIDTDMRKVSITPTNTIAADGWNATTLSLYSHCGTHMDAPRHFLNNGRCIDQQALATCCGPAKVLNLAPVFSRELLTVERFAPWHDAIEPGDRLLLRTDWHRLYGTQAYRDELPRISPELARWLVDRKVALIGVEPPSVADVNNMEELTVVHQTLFLGGVLIIEGLAHLDQLRQDVVELIALPLKITGGDGSPVRAVAIEHD